MWVPAPLECYDDHETTAYPANLAIFSAALTFLWLLLGPAWTKGKGGREKAWGGEGGQSSNSRPHSVAMETENYVTWRLSLYPTLLEGEMSLASKRLERHWKDALQVTACSSVSTAHTIILLKEKSTLKDSHINI